MSNNPQTELTETQKAYNVAQSDVFQLAAYGHHRYHPSGEALTDEGKRQQRDYNDRIRDARDRLEAGLLRLVAEHAEAQAGSRFVSVDWLRMLADDPGELSMLAIRPDEREEILDGREPAATPAVPVPPTTHATDRAALVEVAAQAIRDSNGTPEALKWWRTHPQLIPAHVYAAAVLDVLPPPADRAAVLRDLIAKAEEWDGHITVQELRRMADEAQQQPDTETRDALMRAHVALAEQAGQDQAILARVRRLYESGPLGTCCAHLVGAALGAARQDGACTNCQGSGLDPRYNGEFVCPDCTTAAERQDGAQTQEADRWGVCGDCGAAAGPDCDCPPSSEEQPVPGPGRVADEEQGETGCGPAPDQCDAESGEPCANHEREAAHAEGEHCFCGPECEESGR